jgi:hypothetical protein
VHRDAFAARQGGDAFRFIPIEHLSRQAPDRAFDHNCAHVGRNSAAGRSRQHGLDVRPRESGAARCERHQRESRQGLAGVAGIVVDVAHLRDDHASLLSSQHAQRKLISERARGHEHRCFFTQQRRPMTLECLDFAAQQVVVLGNVPALAQPIQKRCVLSRRDTDAVARGVHDFVGLDCRIRKNGDIRQAAGANRGSERPYKTTTA